MKLMEISLVAIISGTLAAVSLPNLTFIVNPLSDTTNRISANFKLTRTKAVTHTSAYRIRSSSADQLIIERSQSCNSNDWEIDSSIIQDEELKLDEGVIISSILEDGRASSIDSWSLCFNSRGIADRNLALTLKDTDNNEEKLIEVFLGGNVVDAG